MLIVRRVAAGLSAGLCLATSSFSSTASAEGFLDFTLGAAMTDDETIDVSNCSAALTVCPSQNFSFDASFDEGISVALRGGGWFGGAASWLGLGISLSYFTADLERNPTLPGVRADLYVLPVSLQLLLRIPILPDDQFPGGRIQPYVAVGPALATSIIVLDTSDGFGGSDEAADVAFDVGADVRAGLTLMVARWVGLFAEYRYTHIPVEFENEVGNTDAKIEADLDTHHVGGGVTFRF